MRLAIIFSLVLALCCIPTGALAQSPVGDLIEQSRKHYLAGELDKSVNKMRQALDLIWEQAPMWVGTATLVSTKSQGYGDYEPRKNNVYAHNEPIMLYVEPMGFRHRQTEEGKWQFGVEVDFIVKQPDGKVLGGQTGVLRLVKETRNKTKELSISLTYSITGAPPGKYIIETVLRDVITKQTTSLENAIVFRD
jgi:hypothetical protein